MSILEIFKSKAKDKQAKIGIGLGKNAKHNLKIFENASNVAKSYDAHIYIFGSEESINSISEEDKKKSHATKINFIPSLNPESTIIKQLLEGKLDAIIRGSMSSTKFLTEVKEKLHLSEIHRLALLETAGGWQFFYAPVGIDECSSFEEKREFIEKAIKEFKRLSISPNISVLSGGRKGDLGRNPDVDESIKMAGQLVEYFKSTDPQLRIEHDEVLIETAINRKANLIIAPEGISGNLIYRTLVHLGRGKAYGAIYMGLKSVIIDTSRVGKSEEIYGAFLLALALSRN